jgi:hypothetical protein
MAELPDDDPSLVVDAHSSGIAVLSQAAELEFESGTSPGWG